MSDLQRRFDVLCRLEPRLKHLMEEARSWRSETDDSFCANSVWYGYDGHPGIKPRLVSLVGSCRSDKPELQSPAAYDTAYEAIYNALPDCMYCGCICM